jgi:hypothetical protein
MRPILFTGQANPQDTTIKAKRARIRTLILLFIFLCATRFLRAAIIEVSRGLVNQVVGAVDRGLSLKKKKSRAKARARAKAKAKAKAKARKSKS